MSHLRKELRLHTTIFLLELLIHNLYLNNLELLKDTLKLIGNVTHNSLLKPLQSWFQGASPSCLSIYLIRNRSGMESTEKGLCNRYNRSFPGIVQLSWFINLDVIRTSEPLILVKDRLDPLYYSSKTWYAGDL